MIQRTDFSQQQLLIQAQAHYQKNEIKEASTICREILNTDPTCAEAVHLMGVFAFRSGKLETAEDLLRIAISFNRKATNYYCNLAQVLLSAGRLDEAIDFCNRALVIHPDAFES